jgi:protein gp37
MKEVDSIRRQCVAADVPFFFKQWGGKRKDLTGRKLHGRTYDEMPKPTSTRRRSSQTVSLAAD